MINHPLTGKSPLFIHHYSPLWTKKKGKSHPFNHAILSSVNHLFRWGPSTSNADLARGSSMSWIKSGQGPGGPLFNTYGGWKKSCTSWEIRTIRCLWNTGNNGIIMGLYWETHLPTGAGFLPSTVLISFLGGWTSIYQLFWDSPGVPWVLTHIQITISTGWIFPVR